MGAVDVGSSYSHRIAFIYIFNLIVGVGALALPSQFHSAGLISGLIALLFTGFLSWITATWIIEIEASANAFKLLDQKESRETAPLLEGSVNVDESADSGVFEIKERIEMGVMADLFLGKIGQKLFYLIIVIYLFGDLAIYATVVPTSLAKVTKGFSIGSLHMNADNVYYLYLTLFAIIVIPFSLFNFQKTKYMQYFTVATRNISLISMIILGFIFIGQGKGSSGAHVELVEISGVPSLIGVAIYAFMCHHSLPSIIAPVENKRKIVPVLIVDFIFIYITYAILCMSALWAFGGLECTSATDKPGCIQSPYTLNFLFEPKVIGYFLALYPVFTLSTNFPLIAITLRNNVMNLITYGEKSQWRKWRQVIFSLGCTLPPIGLAFVVRKIDILVSFTGSYAGIFIMLILPGIILLYSRKKLSTMTDATNPYRSPVGQPPVIYAILTLSIIFLGVVTYNNIRQIVDHFSH